MKEISKIENERYSVKQAISYYIISYRNTEKKTDFKSIMSELLIKLLEIPEQDEVLVQVNIDILEKIKAYWTLNLDQVVSYAYIVFHNLTFTSQTFTENEIVSECKYVMQLYSPNNAEEFVERQIKRNNGKL